MPRSRPRPPMGRQIRNLFLLALFSHVTTSVLANDNADLIFDDLSGRTYNNNSDTKSISVPIAEINSNKLDSVPSLDSISDESSQSIFSTVAHHINRVKRGFWDFLAPPDVEKSKESEASTTVEVTSANPTSLSTASLSSETPATLFNSTVDSSLLLSLGEVSPLPSTRVARYTPTDQSEDAGFPFSDSPDPNSNSDDEDFSKGGSGEEFAASGEISTNTPEVTEWSTNTQDILTGAPHFYRITIVINEPYNEQYLDHESVVFKQLSANLSSAIDDILRFLGQFSSNLIAVSPVQDMFFLKATVDIEAIDNHDKSVVYDTLHDIIRTRRKIGHFPVEESGFTFRDFNLGTPGSCTANQIFCVPSDTCLPVSARCNSTQECSDGSDELGCPTTCSAEEFLCDLTRCIPKQKVCDGQHDCSDETDEDSEHCLPPEPVGCRSDQFTCSDGQCIDSSQRCDLAFDCKDGGDEEGCSCKDNEFLCDGGRCIPLNKRCNFRRDCEDGTDELNCEVTIPTTEKTLRRCEEGKEFKCRDGMCIPIEKKCDNFDDCKDRSDEQACPCREDMFHCNNSYCVPMFRRCNKINDCQDGSDEMNCPKSSCANTEFQCVSDKKCINRSFRCNRKADCADHSDERNCEYVPPRYDPVPCLSNEFRCGNGLCISWNHRCDNVSDCSDGSDERGCSRYQNSIPSSLGLDLKTYPNEQVIKESSAREVVFQCRDEGPLRAKVRWVRGNGLPLPPGSRDKNGRLEIPDIKIQHSGTYICEAVDYLYDSNARAIVYLNVEEFVQPTFRAPAPACGYNEATCSNGECIPKSKVCDDHYDCTDGSDEMRCNQHGCEPNEFWCANKRCVQKTWRCDSEDDCGDGSDELNCAPALPGSPCKSNEFECRSGRQCTPKSFQCDGQPDCADGSDEVGCAPVTIRIPPPPMVVLEAGSLFTVSCTADGGPTPEIVWRLNWGHIPAKCNTTSVRGVGVLTCPDVQEKDQGAYSCEGINSRGSTFAIPDTILTIKEPVNTRGSCLRGTFNDLALTRSDCINCFCFGVSTQCKSANLFTFQLPPPFGKHQIISVVIDSTLQNIEIKKNELSNWPDVQSIGRDGFLLRSDDNNAINADNAYPYYAFPDSYLGNQLKSYGGYIKYTVRFLGEGTSSTVPDVIISGNGITLVHVGPNLLPNRDNDVSVRFFRGSWIKSGYRNIAASREEIMMVLVNLESVLIRVQYLTGPSYETTITNIRMDSAGNRNIGLGQAAYVEECRCPAGYTGLSCETCLPGYNRRASGPWLGQCYKEEQVCRPGTYGDPSRGIPCQACPCPLANSLNQFGRTCHLDTDGQVTCDCPPEYTGRRCEKCAAGYSGNPLIPGDFCRQGYCDAAGSLSPLPNPSTGQCICKNLVTGSTCNVCHNNTFHLSPRNQNGCISCFCMGLTNTCTSSYWYRNQISSAFVTSNTQDFKLVEYRDIRSPIKTGFQVNPNSRELVYNNFYPGNQEVFYWVLPPRFLGDKITSYGGYLNYTLRYVPAQGGQSSRNSAHDVEIISANNIRLQHFQSDRQIQPNRVETISVPILEQYWQREDGKTANREHLLMALADLSNILIKATYTTKTEEVALTSVTLDVAENRNTGQSRALEVEQCQCPPGHTGLSCEDCDAGYTRQEQGLYLGICEPCACNGHSDQCDPETGVCFNCRDHTTGDFCNICEDGYEGRPDKGEPCLPTGKQDSSCNCDPRGSISPVCVNGLCTCKRNVEGEKCDRCLPGTFDLSASHIDGCLSCYCSGVSHNCQSSSLYQTQIPMELISEQHGFTLTDTNRHDVIRDGFELNVALSQIGYEFKDDSRQQKRLFWSLPPSFTGNRLTSYGGNLTFSRLYQARYENEPTYDQDVIISGKGLTLYWSSQNSIPPDTVSTDIIPLEETHWKRLDQQKVASRADMLKALSSVDAILIRATLGSQITHTYLSDVMLDTAVRQETGQRRASQIEICRCPAGYTGDSCESCSGGYYQDRYGTCSKCPCNGREESCGLDYNLQVVCKCQYGFTGQYCDRRDAFPDSENQVPGTPEPQLEPTISVSISEPKIQIVAVGSSVQFRCSSRSLITNRPLQVVWTKESSRLPHDAIDTGDGLLILRQVQEADSGTYICTSTDGTAIIVDRASLIVGGSPVEPPQVAIFPKTLNVKVGDAVEFRCQATGSPTPTLEWTGARTLNPQHTFSNGIFRIPYAVVTDEGTYQCRATSSGGSVTTNVVLRVRDERPPVPSYGNSIVVTPSSYSGPTGQSVNFTCEVADRFEYSLLWTRPNNQPLPPHAVQGNGVLSFSNISVADNGAYRCSAASLTTGQVLQTADININAYSYSPVRIEPRSQTVPQGMPAELRCIVNENVPIKWSKRGPSPELPSYMQANGPYLRIPSVVLDDRGVYICEVEFHSRLIQKAAATLEVERREAPIVNIRPSQRQTPHEGSNIMLYCEVTRGEPRPTVFWSRTDGRPLSRNVETVSPEFLRFNSITAQEEGEYECKAENKAGSTSAIASIVVQNPPKITITPATTLTVSPGERVRLECSAEGRPTPSVEWTKFYRAPAGLPGYAPGPVPSHTAVFEISEATITDSGTYTCRATNDVGVTEERVELIVTSDDNEINRLPERGDIIGGDPGSSGPGPAVPYYEYEGAASDEVLTIAENGSGELRCNANNPSVSVMWYKRGSATLPDNVEVRGGSLIIRGARSNNAGDYICHGLDDRGRPFEISRRLEVRAPLRIALRPISQTVRPGDFARINCTAVSGDEPVSITWVRDYNKPLHPAVVVGNDLLFYGINVNDTGRYVCQARNPYGQAEGVAEVIVDTSQPIRPIITAEDKNVVAREGSAVTLRCNVQSTIKDYQISWVKGSQPLRETTPTLQLWNVKLSDADRYACRVSSYRGSSIDYINLKVERIDNISLNIESNLDIIHRGDNVELRCHISGNADLPISWQRIGGTFDSNVIMTGSLLRLNNVQPDNAGIYRCYSHPVPSTRYVDYNLVVEGEAPISSNYQISRREANYGTNVTISCTTSIDQPIKYSWIKQGVGFQNPPHKNSPTINIPYATANDAGRYICTAANPKARIDIPTVLTIKNVIPRFTGASSYIKLPPLKNSHSNFTIEIVFKPEKPDGILLYTLDANLQNQNPDFVSLILKNGVPEFKFDLGSGPATVTGDPITIGDWHTILLVQNKKLGEMHIDGGRAYRNQSQGSYVGLDLRQPWHIGGVADLNLLQKNKLSSGFTGCISRLVTGTTTIDLMQYVDKSSRGIESCETCQWNPCLNHGICQEAPNKKGYFCICASGYSGDDCGRVGETCYPGICGEGRCRNTDGDIVCHCPIGKSGYRCQEPVTITVPSFDGDGFIAYRTPKNPTNMKLSMRINPSSVEDGILMYASQSFDGNGDFTSLTIKNHQIEFMFDTGSGLVVLRSSQDIIPRQWTLITLNRNRSIAMLQVANEAPVYQRLGGMVGVDLTTNLYVGGIDRDNITLNSNVQVYSNFRGCISDVSVANVVFHPVKSVIDSANIHQCPLATNNFCASAPCMNNGICHPTVESYTCKCPSQYDGDNCERKKSICDTLHPCLNGGTCLGSSYTYTCSCPLRFKGSTCNESVEIGDEISFNGNGYVELSGDLLPHVQLDDSDIVELQFSTSHNEGILLWHGRDPKEFGRNQDYFAIAIVNGSVEFSYELGSGPVTILLSEQKVNDNQKHTVTARRQKLVGSIQLDGTFSKSGSSKGGLTQLNTSGNVFIGGLPNPDTMTDGKYLVGLSGCIHSLRIQNQPPIHIGRVAISGANVTPCSS
nr:PREDICTED: basement membrane-specific heparan sulfate proteoglycan core protein isoform X4 [Bemisia tabaci]